MKPTFRGLNFLKKSHEIADNLNFDDVFIDDQLDNENFPTEESDSHEALMKT